MYDSGRSRRARFRTRAQSAHRRWTLRNARAFLGSLAEDVPVQV